MDDESIGCGECAEAHRVLSGAGIADGDLAEKIDDLVAERDQALEKLKIAVKGSRAALEPYQSLPHVSTVNFARSLRWHPDGLQLWSLSDWATALAGEVGEACNVIKKMNRHRDGLQQRKVPDMDALRAQLEMELGDVFLYLDLLARAAGFNIEDCIRKTFNRVSEREGFPERL